MPKVGLRQSFDLTTRSQYTKVEAEVGISLTGTELPNMAVLGSALEEAIALIQAKVTESYKVVPPTVNTPQAPATA